MGLTVFILSFLASGLCLSAFKRPPAFERTDSKADSCVVLGALAWFRFWASLSFEEGGVLSEFRRCSDWPSGSVDYSMNLLTRYLCFLGMGPSVSSSDGWTSVDSSRFSPLRKDFKRREDSQKSTISSRTAAVFELPIRSGRNTPHPHLKPPSPPPQPPAPPSSPALGAVVGHGGMLAGWSLVGVGVVEETGKQTTVARG
ncbi:uncharacterized protein [Vicugna pacos]|uniref:Uncharacterized protein isoform X2 n=1 Tax=Vicugna pacos TaxID=30538 RepID=A0ABM5CRB7_VICPA